MTEAIVEMSSYRTYFREALKSPIVIFALVTLVIVVILAPVFAIMRPK